MPIKIHGDMPDVDPQSITRKKMAFFSIIFSIVSLGSILLTLSALYRLYRYIHRYRFSESKYTLLFGFIHLRWIAAAYFICIMMWTAFTFLLT